MHFNSQTDSAHVGLVALLQPCDPNQIGLAGPIARLRDQLKQVAN